jgi:hypothetical protein
MPVPRSTIDGALVNSAGEYHEEVVELLLKHGADATAYHSSALKRAVAALQFDLAQRLLVAGAHGQELDDTAILAAINAKHWPFFITLLQSGISVATTVLPADQAVDFFTRVAPAKFLRDARGNLLPASMRAERLRFAKATANTAAKRSGDDAIKVACWLTRFLTELNSCA